MKINLKHFQDALSKIGSAINAGDFLLNMKATKGRITLHGENDGVSLSVFIEAEGSGSWETAIPKATISQVFGRRSEIEIDLTENQQLKFNATNFEASYSTQPFTPAPDLYKDASLEITDSQQAFLIQSLAVGSLSPIYAADTTFCVHMGKKASFATCFDQLHFAFMRGPGVGEPVAFSFPTNTFETVSRVSKNSNSYTLSANNSSLCAWSSNWRLVLPFVQGEAEQSIASVQKLADSLGSGQARCSASSLYGCITAASSAVEVGGHVTLTMAGGNLTVTASSAIGTVSETIPCKMLVNKVPPIRIDPTIALELINKAESEFIEFGSHAGKFFYIQSEGEDLLTTYGCMLAEE